MSKIPRRTFLAGSISALFLAGIGSRAIAKNNAGGSVARPNILCFTNEDSHPMIGAYGDKLAHTPTIDRLAKEGILYERAYCTSPVCGVSRFSLITGIYAEAAGAAGEFGSTDEELTREIRGMPMYLRDIGYYCTNNSKKNYNSQMDFINIWDESSPKAHWSNRPAGAPFFAVFNTFTTHESALSSRPPRVTRLGPEAVEVPPYLPDTAGVRADFAANYNAMEQMDGELAERLKELEDAGLLEDTIVVYYSDHGGITPRSKRFCYEHGARCPLVIRFPQKWRHLAGLELGSRVTDTISYVDIPATILSLAGVQPPAYMHGAPLLGQFSAKPARYAFTGRDRMDERYDFIRSATDGHFRYIRNYNPHRIWGQHIDFMFQAKGYRDWEIAHRNGTLNAVQDRFWKRKPYEELYDLQQDPHQIHNLADAPEQMTTLQRFREAMDAHMVAVNDNGFIPEGLPLRDYKMSRLPGAYPLKDIMNLASLAAREPDLHFDRLLAALENDHDVVRYWGAMGFLIAGEKSRPYVARLRSALDQEKTVAVRIPLAETLATLTEDKSALYGLGELLDQEDDGPYRLQAINALTYVGPQAKLVLPAIKRSSYEDHRHVRKAAQYLVAVLEGAYDPAAFKPSPEGYVPITPVQNGEFKNGRPYD